MSKNTVIWIVLVSLTLFAFLLGYLKLLSQALIMVLLITTFIKGQLVIDYFMELKNVRLRWRIIPTMWLLTIISLISFAYYNPAMASIAPSLYLQEQQAQKEMDKLYLDSSYQQICQQHHQKVNVLHTNFNILRGDVSRIYFYCEAKYKVKLTNRQRRASEIWDLKDPVSIIECEREKKKQKLAQESNPYVVNRC